MHGSLPTGHRIGHLPLATYSKQFAGGWPLLDAKTEVEADVVEASVRVELEAA